MYCSLPRTILYMFLCLNLIICSAFFIKCPRLDTLYGNSSNSQRSIRIRGFQTLFFNPFLFFDQNRQIELNTL